MSSTIATEHVLDPIAISPDQFTDCAQALIHTIMFHRAIDRQITPKSVHMPGVDIGYASAESAETTQQIYTKLIPMQDIVFSGVKDAWIILSLYYNVPKKGWLRDTFQNEVWERWCIPFSFDTLTAQEIRDAMLHTITQITMKASTSEIPKLPDGGVFGFTMSLPCDKDWETSKEFVKLVKRICQTPTTILQ